MLDQAMPMGFIAVGDFIAARRFYEGILGLAFVSQDDFAMVLQSGPIVLRLARPPELVIAPYTVFGWRVPDIGATAAALIASGVTFERYPWFAEGQDDRGIWTAPNGDRIAWFKDPFGNLLSLSQHSS